jgi:ubiquitin-conjugating enzyme E2 J1
MFNQGSPTVKRLLSEWRALANQPEKDFVACPLGDDLFLWHFTIKGPRATSFEGGVFHGKIEFPPQYPLKPPDIYFFTPNGRFDLNKKICLTMTSFHPDSWNPAWDVRTALTSIIAFLPTKAEGAIGAIDTSDAERRVLARESQSWRCSECRLHIDPDPIPGDPAVPSYPREYTSPDPEPEPDFVGQPSEEVHDNPKIDEEGQPAVKPVEDGQPRRSTFEELRSAHLQSGSMFVPLDVLIFLVFAMLTFIVLNWSFHWFPSPKRFS